MIHKNMQDKNPSQISQSLQQYDRITWFKLWKIYLITKDKARDSLQSLSGQY